jgi:catechol 2,3-dioxygenase-like lactoylglutathione lyase family enzyme
VILGLHHAQITIPKQTEDEAREFYLDALDFQEIDKPEVLAGRGGFWIGAGESTIHVGTEDAGLEILDLVPIPGYDRFETRDPFGNRLEFIQRLGQG